MKWLTEATQKSQPFGSWSDDLADAFVPLEPRKISDVRFCGSILKADLAHLQISKVTASPHCVVRNRTHIARTQGDFYFLNLQIDGLSRTLQRGHEQLCGPGDLSVVDTTEPFEIVNLRHFRIVCFAVRRDLLKINLPDRPRLMLSATEAGRALARTLTGYADLCIGAKDAQVPTSNMGTHLLDLLRYVDACVVEAAVAPAHVPVQLSMMLDHLNHRFAEEGFDARKLAMTFGCSPRYVHKLFSSTGRSVGEHINDRRILASAQQLLDPACRRKTIAEIAFAVGFSDISYFNKLFKRCHGLSPRDFRGQAASTAEARAP